MKRMLSIVTDVALSVPAALAHEPGSSPADPGSAGGGKGPREFRAGVDWPGVAELTLVAAAAANCVSASLVFCLKNKSRRHPGCFRSPHPGDPYAFI